MKTDIEVIDGAIELISGDGAWCQGNFCVGSNGEVVNFCAEMHSNVVEVGYSANPVSFCLEGAIGHLSGYFQTWQNSSAYLQFVRLVELVADQCGALQLRDFNDDVATSQEDAILALKKTRQWLEEHDSGINRD